MSLILKDDMFSDNVRVIRYSCDRVRFVCKSDDNEYNVVVDTDKQKTIELIEFLQECVKEME